MNKLSVQGKNQDRKNEIYIYWNDNDVDQVMYQMTKASVELWL